LSFLSRPNGMRSSYTHTPARIGSDDEFEHWYTVYVKQMDNMTADDDDSDELSDAGKVLLGFFALNFGQALPLHSIQHALLSSPQESCQKRRCTSFKHPMCIYQSSVKSLALRRPTPKTTVSIDRLICVRNNPTLSQEIVRHMESEMFLGRPNPYYSE
jgi:hypothetical protein